MTRRLAKPHRLLGALLIIVGLFTVVLANSASASAGTLLATLHDPAATTGDEFGLRVAISGNTAVVGAPQTGTAGGDVYIYAKGSSGWPTTPTLTLPDPPKLNGDFFGASVAISGTTIVVGAPSNATSSAGPGTAYVYVKGASGWRTTPTVALHDPAATSRDEFGASVAVSGNYAMVGANGTKTAEGAAYLYQKGTSGWPTTPRVSLRDPAASFGDQFGSDVAVSGNTAVIGSFGYPNGANHGAAYIYVKGTTGWPRTPTATLHDPAAHPADDLFGIVAVSITKTIKTILVGAPGTPDPSSGATFAGAAYLYYGGTVWSTSPNFSEVGGPANAENGGGVGLSGSVEVVGAIGGSTPPPPSGPGAGETTMFVNGFNNPVALVQDPPATKGDHFGIVAVSGSTAIVGAPDTAGGGAGYIYTD